jgi:hypothetical protein
MYKALPGRATVPNRSPNRRARRTDRPLACRINPFARWISPESDESFGHLDPHPQTAGVYGTRGTVEDYRTSPGLAPYFAMADRYGELYDRMVR